MSERVIEVQRRIRETLIVASDNPKKKPETFVRWVADVTEDGEVVWSSARGGALVCMTSEKARAVKRHVLQQRSGEHLRGAVRVVSIMRCNIMGA